MIRRHSRTLAIAGIALFSFFALGAATASADPIVWNGGGDTSEWDDVDNWDAGVPMAGDEVTIPAEAFVTDVPAIALDSLTVADDASLEGTGPLTLSAADLGDSVYDVPLVIIAGTNAVEGQFGENVTFTTTGATTFSNASFDSDATIAIGSGTTVNFGALTIAADLNVTGTATFGSSAAIDGALAVSGTATFGANAQINGGFTLTGTATLGASSHVFANDADQITLNSGATLNVASGDGGEDAESRIGRPVVINGGTLNVTGSLEAEFDETVTLTTGTFANTANTTFNEAASFNGGTLNSSSGSTTFRDHAVIAAALSAATLSTTRFEDTTSIAHSLSSFSTTIAEDAVATVTAAISSLGVSITNDGELILDPGAALAGGFGTTVTNTGRLEINTGLTLSGAMAGGNLNNSGSLSVNPGAGSSLTLTGTGATITNSGSLFLTSGTIATPTFTQTVDGTYYPQLMAAGTTPGTSFSQLNVGAEADLAGTIRTSVDENYPATAVGTTLPIITYGSLDATNNTFATVEGTGFDNAGTYAAPIVSPTATNVVTRKATATVTNPTVAPGGSFNVTGTGFLPGDHLNLVLAFSEGEMGDVPAVKNITADASGNISGSVTVPADTTKLSSATVKWSLYAHALGGASVKSDVTVAKPTAPVLDADGDLLNDSVDCAPNDKSKPAQGAGVVDKDCNGVNDLIQPVKFISTSPKPQKVTTAGGNDTITTGKGNDKISSGAGNDKIKAGDGNNVVDAGAGNDDVTTGKGKDKIKLGAGKDKVNSGAGNDTIDAKDKTGIDTVKCGPGKDTVVADKKDKVAKDCEKVKRS